MKSGADLCRRERSAGSGGGRISAGGEPNAVFANNLARVRAGAEAAGREFDDRFHTAALTFSCVLKPGEKLTSDRGIDQVGSMATAFLHFWWELYRQSGSDVFILTAPVNPRRTRIVNDCRDGPTDYSASRNV